MFINLKIKFWTKIKLKMILELATLLLLNFILLNLKTLTYVIKLIHNIRIYRINYNLLNKAKLKNNKEEIKKYEKKLSVSYNKICNIGTKIKTTIIIFSEEEKKDKKTEFSFFKFLNINIKTRKNSVSGIFRE